MTPIEFFKARLDEDERLAKAAFDTNREWVVETGVIGSRVLGMSGTRVLADIAAKRKIIEWHESWPVLVDTEPEYTPIGSLESTVFQISRQVAWLTNREYRKRFGDEPPTSAIIMALIQPYREHEDFDEGWIR